MKAIKKNIIKYLLTQNEPPVLSQIHAVCQNSCGSRFKLLRLLNAMAEQKIISIEKEGMHFNPHSVTFEVNMLQFKINKNSETVKMVQREMV